MSKITAGILKKIGQPDLTEKIAEQLSLSELSSLLLEIFRETSKQITPAELQKNYEVNRFVLPVQYNTIDFLEFELLLLKLAAANGFTPMELSPVSPLGTCSVIATVDQNKIVSASRGTEVVADATNSIALECSKIRKEKKFDSDDLHFCTAHRHIRAQQIGPTRGHTPHFKIFCAVSAGKDKGSFEFEKNILLRHLNFYKTYLTEILRLDKITIRFKALNTGEENRLFKAASSFVKSNINDFKYEHVNADQNQQQYYKDLQFKIYASRGDKEFEIGDGGFVDWTQKLTGNKKERMMISAIGSEFLFKILNDLL